MNYVVRRPGTSAPWAARLRRHLAWAIAIKLVLIALLFALLFALFFSSSHRPSIDAGGVSDHLRLTR
jgi:hypothetical protein